MALAVTCPVPPAVSYGLIEYLRRLGVMRQLGLSLCRVVPHGGRQMSLNIAAAASWRQWNRSYRVSAISPMGSGLADGYVGFPKIPGIGFEAESALYQLKQELLNCGCGAPASAA